MFGVVVPAAAADVVVVVVIVVVVVVVVVVDVDVDVDVAVAVHHLPPQIRIQALWCESIQTELWYNGWCGWEWEVRNQQLGGLG